VKIAVFDMDGTLACNDAVAIDAARDGLVEYWTERGEAPRIPDADHIRGLVGLPSREYFGGMLPPERAADIERLADRIEEHEAERLARGEGRRFDGVDRTIGALRADGWRLALVSNCRRTYFEANLTHVLDPAWFDAARCLSDHPTKTANVDDVLVRIAGSAPRFAVMIGDRATDMEAGRANGMLCVGCLYGFGNARELAAADRTVADVTELPGVLADLAAKGGV
jgi:phosphoglycolate phosphatase-like HAD superfamily hydrolase